MRLRVAVLLLAICIAGCSRQGPEADLDAYIDKLARVLDQQIPHPTPHAIPRMPEVHELRRDFPGETINLLQFLEIRDCELGHLVAERNSALGKLAAPSQRLVYDLGFLRTGDACRKLVGTDHPGLAATLTREMARKRRQLPAVIWRATLGGPEFRKFWRFGGSPLPSTLPPDDDALLAIKRLHQEATAWLAGDYRVDPDDLERQLDAIRHGHAGLELRAWDTVSNKLDIATQLLADRETRRRLCFPGMHPPAAGIFGTVAREVLIQRIQPWVAQLNRHYYQLFPAIRSLEAALAAGEPPAYRGWRERRDAGLDYATHALLRHVNRLQPILAQCNLMPQVR